MFRARKRWENGTEETQEFTDYDAMVVWFAAHPEAGMMVWNDGEAFETERFIQLQLDVEALAG